ncbi:amidohydrolase [Gulosibacter chungangensis]|uniref:Amidohydrolase family protein n=1 Tax=Gulosibacter chungangensis TaxID=979746 RepID=A0A7J5BDF9_9MICO|nr:amidohydrolase [Gulosibacter chungangensis]KAB1644247.1 amidohydrolase family protein [Gulosibacter chungangensis]
MLIVSNVRPWGKAPVDLLIEAGVITEARPHRTVDRAEEASRVEVIDGRGLLALPGFVNAHAHVDKSWWGQPWVSYGGEDTTEGRIAHERAERDKYGIPSADGATRILREFLRHGTTATRSHVDVDLGTGLRGLHMVQEAAASLDGAIDVELVAFPQDGVLRRPGVLDLLDQAAAEGRISAIGGLDPATIDRDPVGQLDALFEIADRRQVGIDIHLHDHGDLGAFQYELLIERTRALGLAGRVNVSHGFALGELSGDVSEKMLNALAESGISWTTVAPVRSAPLPWQGMRNLGILLGLGTDGIRDLWSPFGDGDMLAIALGFARLHGLHTDADLTYAVELASSHAARFVDRDQHELKPGCRADIVLLDAQNVADALTRVAPRSLVIAGGRVVATEGEVIL